MIIEIFGVAGTVVTLLVFLTGRPSIHHFIPLQPGKVRSLLPSPAVRWKLFVRDHTLFMRWGSLEIAVLTGLEHIQDYRIFSSGRGGKIMVLYRYTWKKAFTEIVIVNWNGSNREEHHYPSGILDARWFNRDTYIIYLEPGFEEPQRCYPYFWQRFDQELFGKGRRLRSPDIETGNYLVQLGQSNQIVSIKRY